MASEEMSFENVDDDDWRRMPAYTAYYELSAQVS